MNEAAQLSVFRQPYDPEEEPLQALDNLHTADACLADQGVIDNTTETPKQNEPFATSAVSVISLITVAPTPFFRNKAWAAFMRSSRRACSGFVRGRG